MLPILSLLTGLTLVPGLLGQCLEHDAKPPLCTEWISTNNEPVFIEHQYNCSRFWVCQPDLSDCLHECAKATADTALYFDVSYQYPLGPVCDWPANIDCDPKPIECKDCEVWQDCVESDNGYICIPDCHIDPHCDDDEYCDFPDGGDGNCHKGCRNNAACGSNVHPCGICTDHACVEPMCCTDEDCPDNKKCVDGTCEFQCLTDDDCKPDEYCENGECLKGCNEDSDCSNTTCSSCGTDHQCVDPGCCSDDDCSANEYCDNGECKDGCNEDSDCTANGLECAVCGSDNQCTRPECCTDSNCSDMSCSTCGSDFQCVNPECCSDDDCSANEYCDNGECKDGCNEDSDCTGNGLECAVCGSDNQCTTPECCTDDDCSVSAPICTEDNVCADGCRDDPMCPGFDAVCTIDYANCNYCNKTETEDYGDCEPGCIDDDNCDGSQVCNGFHKCIEQGTFKTLKQIIFTTELCKDCQATQMEDGPLFNIVGESSMSGTTSCDTNQLDHENVIDFAPGHTAIFEDVEDKDVLGTCFRANLQGGVTGGSVLWTASVGEWSLKGNRVDFTWSDTDACKSSCCLDNTVLTAVSNTARLVNCQKNCQDTLVCPPSPL